jgi:hypothetical protein
MRITFVTSADARNVDPDLPLLLAAAERAGVEAQVDVWDDPEVDWLCFDAIVIRSCWDYTARLQEFLAWAASVPHLHNGFGVLRWNTDKTYLRELAAAGVPVIETRWDVTDRDELPDATEWVVKPTVSAGSKDTARWGDPAEVHAHSAQLLAAGRSSMTQPYVASVDDEGETALLFFGGRFSHAIGKGPLLERGEGVRDDRDGREQITERTPTEVQHDVAARAVQAVQAAVGQVPLYVRVDLVTAADGSPLLIELEAAEPSLFLPQADEAASDRFLAALQDTSA